MYAKKQRATQFSYGENFNPILCKLLLLVRFPFSSMPRGIYTNEWQNTTTAVTKPQPNDATYTYFRPSETSPIVCITQTMCSLLRCTIVSLVRIASMAVCHNEMRNHTHKRNQEHRPLTISFANRRRPKNTFKTDSDRRRVSRTRLSVSLSMRHPFFAHPIQWVICGEYT